MPASATLYIDRPDALAHLSPNQYSTLICEATTAHEAKARAKRRREGKGVLGIAKILAAVPSSSPGTRAPRRQVRPRVACGDAARRIKLLDQLCVFYGEHRRVRQLWRAGDRTVRWPAGTYQMRFVHGAVVDTT